VVSFVGKAMRHFVKAGHCRHVIHPTTRLANELSKSLSGSTAGPYAFYRLYKDLFAVLAVKSMLMNFKPDRSASNGLITHSCGAATRFYGVYRPTAKTGASCLYFFHLPKMT